MAGREKRLGINYKKLTPSCSIVVLGSVPDLQSYQADLDEYTPDYTLTPLTLLPICNATNGESYVASTAVNDKLTSMKWYEQVGQVKTHITESNLNYIITESGAEKGKIVMNRNSHTLKPVALVFEAEYVDPRDGSVYHYRKAKLVNCMDATPATPVIHLDSPSSLTWNPLRDIRNQVITAKVIVSNQDVTNTAKCKLFFYRLLSTGAHELVGTSGDNDWEVVSLQDNALTIDREKIGNQVTYIVKASYDDDGNPASEPDLSIDAVTTTIVRRIPKLDDPDWQGVQDEVPEGTTSIYPTPVIRDAVGVLDNASIKEWIKCVWSTKAASASSYTQVEEGYAPTIPFSDGMMMRLELVDRGPKHAVVVSGKVLTVGGKAILVRKY